MIEQQMRVLVTVKAYPQPSRSYGETVCVAGVRIDTDEPSWIRLYPVAYRDLPFADRFQKYQIVDLRAFRSTSDTRPESYKPIISSVQVGASVGSGHGWRARWHYLRSVVGETTACELYAKQASPDAPSLGLVKPRLVSRLDIAPTEAFADEKRQMAEAAAAANLFGPERAVLEPAPYQLKYHYYCLETGCHGHQQTLIDWEAGQAARKWKAAGRSDEEVQSLLSRKFFDELCSPSRDTYFFLGNQHQHRKSFLVLGVFWPPAGSRPHPTLFN